MSELQAAKLLRIYLAESDRSGGRPLHEIIVEKCREMQIAGATVLRAHEGFGSGPEIHHAHLLAHDRPIKIMIVDNPAKIERLIPELESLLQSLLLGGTMVVSKVQAMRVRGNN